MKFLLFAGLFPLYAYAAVIGARNSTSSIQARKTHILCLTAGQSYTATWTQHDGLICQYTDLVGINYKNPPQVWNDRPTDDHNCMGMCGEGCDGIRIGGAYTQDCFNHDMCTYFNDVDEGKKKGRANHHCGDEYKHAEGDFAFGMGCGDENGKNPLHYSEDVEPSGFPRCRYPGGDWFEKDFSEGA